MKQCFKVGRVEPDKQTLQKNIHRHFKVSDPHSGLSDLICDSRLVPLDWNALITRLQIVFFICFPFDGRDLRMVHRGSRLWAIEPNRAISQKGWWCPNHLYNRWSSHFRPSPYHRKVRKTFPKNQWTLFCIITIYYFSILEKFC